MAYRPKDGSEPFVPHVIEPSFGLERLVMAVLTSAYTVDTIGGEERTVAEVASGAGTGKSCSFASAQE